jgi:hypothetical protein
MTRWAMRVHGYGRRTDADLRQSAGALVKELLGPPVT